jgi:hypothetical protein
VDQESFGAQHRRTWRGMVPCVIALVALVWIPPAQAQRSSQSRQPTTELPQVAEINRLIEAVWQENGLTPSPPATDEEWCRRTYLDVIGRIPTVEELEAFLKDRSADRRRALVDRLLLSDESTIELARNWTTIWTNLLIGRTGGTQQNSLISRDGMQKYLRDCIANNKPYDEMVRELITATGSTQPGQSDFNGATNFLIDKVNEENAAQATAATSRLFLGLQVQCTQCHDHPFNQWKQRKYWEMNAFFRQLRAVPDGVPGQMNRSARLADQDYNGESGNPDEADLFYELRNGLVKVAFPVFVDGTTISKNGRLDVVNRREELARMVVESPYLATAAVNRMWSHFLGYGFTSPVDDMGPHNPASHPQLLDYLAEEFRASGYDSRQLIRWIVLSRPYGLASRPSSNNDQDDPQLGNAPKFSRFYLRQMRAEELYESLLVATGVAQSQGSFEEQERRKNLWLQQFAQAFGTDEGDETTSFNGTIPQVLMMFNGEMVREATGGTGQTWLEQLINDPQIDDEDKVHRLFLAGLSRRATGAELTMARQLFIARQGDARQAMQDLWWAILNSNEFILNH